MSEAPVRPRPPTELPGAEFLSAEERAALARAGYGGSVGLGRAPALLVVDVTMGFCGPAGADIATAVNEYPHACGPAAWEAMPAVRTLVEGARTHGVPIVFTRGSDVRSSQGRWADKNRRQSQLPADASQIVTDSGYRAGDLVVEKEGPSAFHGTPLLRWLVGQGIDSVVVAGTTTSGCVRATVVDGFSYNFKVAVASDATFDRVNASHRMSLFDMGLKYADVLSVVDLVREFDRREG